MGKKFWWLVFLILSPESQSGRIDLLLEHLEKDFSYCLTKKITPKDKQYLKEELTEGLKKDNMLQENFDDTSLQYLLVRDIKGFVVVSDALFCVSPELDCDETKRLIEGLQKSKIKMIYYLSEAHVDVSDIMAEGLAHLMKYSSILKHIYVDGRLTDLGNIVLLSALGSARALQDFRMLNWVHVQEGAILCLGESLRHNRSLKSLFMRGFFLSDHQLARLVTVLKTNDTLSYISLPLKTGSDGMDYLIPLIVHKREKLKVCPVFVSGAEKEDETFSWRGFWREVIPALFSST